MPPEPQDRCLPESAELPFPRGEEALDLLLPEEAKERRQRAMRVTSFLRLLSADARSRRAESASIGLETASGELQRQARDQIAELLEELLHHHLRAELGAESFAWYGPERMDPQRAWSTLESARAEHDELPLLPGPGESALEVAARLVDGLERAGCEPARFALARARLARAESGAARGERAFEELLAGAAGELGAPERRAALAGLVECQLDRGAVRAAHLRLAELPPTLRSDPRLARLACWARLLAGDLSGALGAAAELGPWPDLLPAPLLELRRSWPAALPCLSGRELARPPRTLGAQLDAQAMRSELGAAAFAVFRFGPGRSAHPLQLELAPGLRAARASWLEGREGACAMPDQPEHRLVLTAAPVRIHRAGGRALPGALGRETSLALALQPLREEGEVEGWLWVECEHHLLPSARRLEALADLWRPRLRESRPCIQCGGPRAEPRLELRVRELRSPGESLAALAEPARSLVAETFEALVRALGIKTKERAWWGIVAGSAGLRLAARGGEGLAGEERGGGARALARSLASCGSVLFDEPDARLSIHPRAASGVVLALAVRGEPAGLLAIESARRRDFGAADVRRLEELARPFAFALRCARFRAWHLERHGHDLYLDASLPAFRAFGEDLIAAARARAAVLVHGPEGSGKTVMARWLHCESARAEEQLVERAPAQGGPGLAELLERCARGSLTTLELARAPAEAQEELVRALESGALCGAEGARWIATASEPLDRALREGRLRPELAAALERVALHLPPLCDRREELAGLLGFFLARFAAEEREPAPHLAEDALALLWRQPWSGNLRQLESFAFKLVLLRPGEQLSAADVRAVARRFRLPLVARLPSRHPRRRDVVAALRSTLKGSGSFNKRRAAQLLGWDPDTLAARLRESRLDERALEAEPGAWEPSAS